MIELILYHDGSCWVAGNGDISVAADTLDRLDDRVRDLVRDHGNYKGTGNRKVMMRFDNSTIPGWIRQYMPHYFNRMITVETG